MKFTIEIASVPDRAEVVAEIWWGNAMVAELHRSVNGNSEIEIYPPKSQESWVFNSEDWIAAIKKAEECLGIAVQL